MVMSQYPSKGNLAELGDRLKEILEGVQDRYETFIDDAQLFRSGKIDEANFFHKLGEYLLELTKANFLEAQLILELKNTLEEKGKGIHTNSSANEMRQTEVIVKNKYEDSVRRKCNSCGAEISAKAKFCRSCGQSQGP